MQRVTGIGGVFFRAKDRGMLEAWYEQYLGIPKVPKTYEEGSWWQDEGPTVFAPFDDKNEYLGQYKRSWILNFRVEDLDAMVEQLRSSGIEVQVDPEQYPNGRFASLYDPEGNPIQLWQPMGTDEFRPDGK